MLRPAWNPNTNQFEMDGDGDVQLCGNLKIWLIIQLKQPVNNGLVFEYQVL